MLNIIQLDLPLSGDPGYQVIFFLLWGLRVVKYAIRWHITTSALVLARNIAVSVPLHSSCASLDFGDLGIPGISRKLYK